MTERQDTEPFVEDVLRALGYEDCALVSSPSVGFERKTTFRAPDVQKQLNVASKRGTGKRGEPEFIITFDDQPELVVLVECKSDLKDHCSPGDDYNPIDCAVDGALHYAHYVSSVRTVIAVAVSGDKKRSDWTFFKVAKGTAAPTPAETARATEVLTDLTGTPVAEMPTPEDLPRFALLDRDALVVNENRLIAYAGRLHNFLRSQAKMPETEKPLVVAGTLLALNGSVAFRKTYRDHKPDKIGEKWLDAIDDALAGIPSDKKKTVLAEFRKVSSYPALVSEVTESEAKRRKGVGSKTFTSKTVLHEIIGEIEHNVLRYAQDPKQGVDVLGLFYGEFLKYSGGDSKGLGIVLTPRHITELFADLAGVNKDSVVLDTCTGTGGFLIAAMRKMLAGASRNHAKRIKESQLIGVEFTPHMYSMAAANMKLRGDGKSNLFLGSCFDPAVQDGWYEADGTFHKGVRTITGIDHTDPEAVRTKNRKAFKPDVGFINPPYSQDDYSELQFTETMLDLLEPNGTGIAIFPISAVTSKHQTAKNDILSKHTLWAVMTMPPRLFPQVGTQTVIAVFKAHKPHAESGTPTWFARWTDDGFEQISGRGRVDVRGRWTGIRETWLDDYLMRQTVKDYSVLKIVKNTDDWHADAFLGTDYSTLSDEDFITVLFNSALFLGSAR